MNAEEGHLLSDDARTDPRAAFASPPVDAAPMMRWWWFGPAVERDEIRRELTQMRDAGFGGAELAFMYPLSVDTDTFLSSDFLEDVRFAGETARDLGLVLDVTLGSGWSFGGPHIDAPLAARRLHREYQEIPPAAASVPVPVAWPHEEFVAAYVGPGSIQEMPDVFERVDVVDGELRIPPGAGARVLLVCTSRPTGQNVKRAAVGAEGPVLDHYSRAAVERHIEVVCDPLLDALPPEVVGSVFCDSLEVYRADWTPLLPEEFERRHGSSLLDDLWRISADGAEGARLRSDIGETLADLYEENFLQPLHAWARDRGAPFRVQSYGEPPARISSYRHADRFEGEGWGWRDIPQTRWASSAARLHGRSLVSSEIWTWNHSPSFRSTPLDLVGELHEHLLCGINRFYGHGWPYSPPEVPGVGWSLYAAAAIDARSPWWTVAPELTRYIQRLSWLLGQGERVAKVGIYAPTRDVFAGIRPDDADALNLWRKTVEHIGTAIPSAIRDAGHDFDLFDDPAIDVLAVDAFDVVVLPRVRDVPAPTGEWLARARAGGVRVISVDSGPDAAEVVSQVDALVVSEAEFGAGLDDLLGHPDGPVAIRKPDRGSIGVTHRRADGLDVWFVANTTAQPRTVEIVADASRASWERWHADSGRCTIVDAGRDVELAPYEALVLVGLDHAGAAAAVGPDARTELLVDHGWTVRFDGEVEAAPVSLPHRWEDDPGRRDFSGSATYRTTFALDRAPEAAELRFGDTAPRPGDEDGEVGIRGRSFRAAVHTPVGDVAVVTVNGRTAGSAWRPPYRVDLGSLLREGDNVIEVTVSNTLANALAADPHVAERAAESEARFGRRFRMQDVESAARTVSSGLHAVPRIALR